MTPLDWAAWVAAIHRPQWHDDECPEGVVIHPWWAWARWLTERHGAPVEYCEALPACEEMCCRNNDDWTDEYRVNHFAAQPARTDACRRRYGECDGTCVATTAADAPREE